MTEEVEHEFREVHDRAGDHPSFRGIAVGAIVLAILMVILVPLAIRSASHAADTSQVVSASQQLASCRAEYGVDVTIAQAKVDKARALLEHLNTDMLAAAIQRDTDKVAKIVAGERPQRTAALDEAVTEKDRAVMVQDKMTTLARKRPEAFLKICERKP